MKQELDIYPSQIQPNIDCYDLFEKYPSNQGGYRAEVDAKIAELIDQLNQVSRRIAFLKDAIRILDEVDLFEAVEIKKDLEKAYKEYDYLTLQIVSLESDKNTY